MKSLRIWLPAVILWAGVLWVFLLVSVFPYYGDTWR